MWMNALYTYLRDWKAGAFFVCFNFKISDINCDISHFQLVRISQKGDKVRGKKSKCKPQPYSEIWEFLEAEILTNIFDK